MRSELLLTPAPGRRAAVAGSILVERLTGFLVMLALCTLGLALRPQYFDEPGLRAAILAAVLTLELAVAAALLAPRWLAPFLWRLAVRLPAILGRVAGSASRVAAAVADLAQAPAVLGRAMGLSAVFYGTIIVAQHAVLQAVGAEVPLVEVALVAAVVPLATMLPMSLNGLGVAEGVFVLLYAQLGVEPEVALAAAVLRRVVDVANSGLGGLVWLGSQAAGRAGKGLQHVPAGAEDRMSDRAGTRGPATAMVVMLTGALTWELYHHLSVKRVPLPMLLFELLEVVLLVGCTLTCTLLVLRVRMRAMVAATAGMLAVLLTGELYLAVAPVTPPMLFFELLEVVLLVGASIVCALLVRPAAGSDQGRVRNVCI